MVIAVNPIDFILEKHWQLCSYEIFSHILKMPISEMKEKISDSSFVFYSDTYKIYVIIYNAELNKRILISRLAHEIGHICLGHIGPENTWLSKRSEEEEAEADIYALQHFRLTEEQTLPVQSPSFTRA